VLFLQPVYLSVVVNTVFVTVMLPTLYGKIQFDMVFEITRWQMDRPYEEYVVWDAAWQAFM